MISRNHLNHVHFENVHALQFVAESHSYKSGNDKPTFWYVKTFSQMILPKKSLLKHPTFVRLNPSMSHSMSSHISPSRVSQSACWILRRCCIGSSTFIIVGRIFRKKKHDTTRNFRRKQCCLSTIFRKTVKGLF